MVAIVKVGPGFNSMKEVTRGHEERYVDWEKLKETTRTSVLFLNRILDASEMPIPECQEAMELTRKIGLGIMGLHDILIQLGLPYDSEKGRALASEIMKFISEEADTASYDLAEAEGPFKGAVDSEGHSISDAGFRRNACLTTIAPTGTLSMIADCSSGCEPYYAPVTYKTVLDGAEFAMPNKWVAKRMEEEGATEFKFLTKAAQDLFKGAGDIHWRDHILMQAVLQEWVDSSISKTINMSNDATKMEVKGAYELAYETGCKGVTVYRDGSRETQVLSTTTGQSDETCSDGISASSGSRNIKKDLGDVLTAKRYRVKVHDQKVYILVAEDDTGAPVEIFVKFPYATVDDCYVSLCRQLSLSMRYGVPLSDIVKQLEKSVVVVNDAPSHLARILKMYMQSKGTLAKINCPGCGEGTVIFTEGCEKCGNCGWSKCS